MTVEKFVTRYIVFPIIVLGFGYYCVSIYIRYTEEQQEIPFPAELEKFDQKYNSIRKEYGIPTLPVDFLVKRYTSVGLILLETFDKDKFPKHFSKRIEVAYNERSEPDSIYRELDIFHNKNARQEIIELWVISPYPGGEKIRGRLEEPGSTVKRGFNLSKEQVDSILLKWDIKY